MKLTVDRVEFLKTLTTVYIAIGAKSPSPALMNFKLEMENERLVVTGSNNEMTIQSVLPTSRENKIIISDYELGATLISAKYLIEIIRKLDSSLVTIEIIDQTIVKIRDDKSEFKLNSMRAEEYPDLDLDISGEAVEFSAEDFKRIVAQTAFAASTKESSPIITAINVKADNDVIDFSATDRFRLSKKKFKVSDNHQFEANIPTKTIVEVSKLLDGGVVRMIISEKKVVFIYAETTIFSRLIGGEFPNTTRMIPLSFMCTLKINSEKFIEAMQRVSLLVTETESIVKLTLTEEEAVVSSRSEQIGSAEERIELFEYSGGPFTISFNVNYVIDAIKAAMSEDVILSFVGETSLFKVTSPNDESLVQIVTPVRTYN